MNVENTSINTAADVSLDGHKKTIVGSVLDLFSGKPSLSKLQLWADDATFEDPLAVAKGRKQFEAQWYGLQTAFSKIEVLHHNVTAGGNPITMDMKNRYVVKGIEKEQTINSVVNIFLDSAGKIERLEDKWDGKLPESGIANVSLFSPSSWLRYYEGWAFWLWSFAWNTRLWLVILTSTVPCSTDC